MEENLAITIDNVSKDFKLPHEKIDSVKGLFVNPFKRRKGSRVETQHALKNVSFEIKKGEFFGIVGRNGSGKSTLLKLIAGIYQPTKGSIQVNGRLVPFIELGVGFNPDLTGKENVYLNGALMGFSTKEVDRKYESIVDFAELDRFMDQKLKNYSSGMQVRLAFSVATILADSDILLIDEVLAVGDADFQRKCFNYFRRLKKDKKTVIFVSHDMEAVREYCDRCVVLKDSSVIFSGDTEKAADMYMEMFNKQNNALSNEHIEGNRWGSEDALFSEPTIDIAQESVTINAKVKVKRSIENPIIGVQVTNASGHPVCGTNSRILRIKHGKLSAGDEIDCVWKLPNIFSAGEYTIDVAVTHQDGITQFDWWRDALSFSIINEHSTPHVVSPLIDMDVLVKKA